MSASDRPDVWSVVKVPYPYTDRPARQSRPVLVVARTAEAAGTPLLWVLMITSAANRGWAGDVPISDLAAAGLPAPSLVRCEKIATVDAREVSGLGHLPVADRPRVTARLGPILAEIFAGAA